MSCSKCGSTTAGCGCKDTAYTTPMVTTCVPDCPPKCAEYISATCVLMQDGINELGSNPGDTLESLIQRLTLIITNPLCVDWNPGSGGGGGGGGIVQVGLVAPSNLFETPIVPVTTPGGDLTLTLNDQSSNTVFAGPTSGPDSTPQFRALVIDDLPNLTTGTSVLMGDGAGKFANVIIGPNLSFSGGVLDANVNVVIGADNGLTKDPSNTDTVWLGGPSTNPGTLIQETFIDTTDQWRLNLYGDNPAAKRGVLEVDHTANEVAIKATASTGTAVSANIVNGVTAVYASSTGSGVGLTAESDSGTAISYTSTSKSGIIGESADENIFTVTSTTAPSDSTVSSVLRLTKNYNASSVIGIGSRLDFGFYNPAASDKTSGTITSVTTAVTTGAETADLRFSTIGNGTLETVGEFIGGNGLLNGQFRLNKYGANSFNTGTPLYGLAVDVQGKVMEVPLASGIGTVNNGLSLNPSLASEAWLGGTLLNPSGTVITVPDTFDFTISGSTVTASKSALVVKNTAGATGTRALTVESGGAEAALYVKQDTTATAAAIEVVSDSTNAGAIGVKIQSDVNPLLAKTTPSSNNTQSVVAKFHNESGGAGATGIGGLITLSAATVTQSDREVAQIGYQFTDGADSSRKGQLEFSTANPTLATRMIIKETGQVQFNNYTTSTSFTTAVGASLLGIDTSGNIVNSIGENGLTYSTATGNIKLGGTLIENTTIVGSDKSLTLTFDGLIGTNGLNITSSNTTAATSQTLVRAVLSGTNAGANITSYAISGANSHVSGGATSNNYGVFGTATGGDVNYGVGGSISGTASGAGVFGSTTSTAAPGVYGRSTTTSPGVRADNTNSSGQGISVTAVGSNASGGSISGGTSGLLISTFSNTTTSGLTVSSTNSSFATIVSQPTNCRGLWINSFNTAPTATDVVRSSIDIRQVYTGVTTTNGFGSSIDFNTQAGTNNTDVALANSIISKWTDAAFATRTSEFSITGVNSSTLQTQLTLKGTGQLQLNRYITGAFTSGTPEYNLAVDTSGNVMQVPTTSGSSPLISMLAGDVSTNNTLADVTGLSFPVTAGKTYYFKFMCPYEINSTARGSRWTINGPAFSFLSYYSQYSPTTGGADFFRNLNVVAYDTAVATGSSTATTGNIAIIEGVITPSASGNVIARFSTDATAGGTLTCKAGSTVTYYTT